MIPMICYKLNFCRITLASKLFVRNNYFPLFKVQTPQDATKEIVKNNFTPKNHYMPVLLSQKKRERLSAGKRIKEQRNYGKRMHSKIDDFKYMSVVLKMDDDKHKKILDILKSKKTCRGNYVYKIEERNTCLVFNGEMEEAVRSGDISDVTISDNTDKMIMRLKNGEKITAEASTFNLEEMLHWGEAATTKDTESKHHYGKMIMSIAHIFEMKERCAALYELEKMKFEAKKKQRVEREWKSGLEPLLENLLRENEANKENEPSNDLHEIESKEFQINISDMSKTSNVPEKIENGGEEAVQKLPLMKEINKMVKRLGEGQFTEVAGTPGVSFKVGDSERFLIGQMVTTDKNETIFVPGQTFETTTGVKYLPGITVNLDNTPTFIAGVIMADDTNAAVFLPGQSIITEDGTMRFTKEGERVTPVGMKKLQMTEDEQWERVEKRKLARETLEKEKQDKLKAEAKERKRAKKEKLDRKKADKANLENQTESIQLSNGKLELISQEQETMVENQNAEQIKSVLKRLSFESATTKLEQLNSEEEQALQQRLNLEQGTRLSVELERLSQEQQTMILDRLNEGLSGDQIKTELEHLIIEQSRTKSLSSEQIKAVLERMNLEPGTHRGSLSPEQQTEEQERLNLEHIQRVLERVNLVQGTMLDNLSEEQVKTVLETLNLEPGTKLESLSAEQMKTVLGKLNSDTLNTEQDKTELETMNLEQVQMRHGLSPEHMKEILNMKRLNSAQESIELVILNLEPGTVLEKLIPKPMKAILGNIDLEELEEQKLKIEILQSEEVMIEDDSSEKMKQLLENINLKELSPEQQKLELNKLHLQESMLDKNSAEQTKTVLENIHLEHSNPEQNNIELDRLHLEETKLERCDPEQVKQVSERKTLKKLSSKKQKIEQDISQQAKCDLEKINLEYLSPEQKKIKLERLSFEQPMLESPGLEQTKDVSERKISPEQQKIEQERTRLQKIMLEGLSTEQMEVVLERLNLEKVSSEQDSIDIEILNTDQNKIKLERVKAEANEIYLEKLKLDKIEIESKANEETMELQKLKAQENGIEVKISDKMALEKQTLNANQEQLIQKPESQIETKLKTLSNENVTMAEQERVLRKDDLADFSVTSAAVGQKTEKPIDNQNMEIGNAEVKDSAIMHQFNEEILAGIFLQDHKHLVDPEQIDKDKELVRAKYLLVQQEEERKKNAIVADDMKDILESLEIKKTKLMEKLRNIQNETYIVEDRAVTYIYPAKANALAIELGFDGQIARNIAKMLLGITRWANTYSAKFHVHSENIDIVSYSSEIDEEFHLCSDDLKSALKAAMVAAVEVFKLRPKDLEGGMRAAGKLLLEAVELNGLIIHEIALTLDHKTNSERNVLFSSTLKDLTKKLVVNKAETLKSIIREEFTEDNLISKMNLVIEEEGDILVRAFTNLTNNNSELVKKVYTNVINTASELLCEEKSGEAAHRAIVDATQELAEVQLNKFLRSESSHAIKHLLVEALHLAEIIGQKNEAKTIDRLLNEEENVVSVHVLATDQITLDILRRVLIMRQLAERNPQLSNGMSMLRREPRQAREDRNTRELVRESAALNSHACPILSSLDIPSFLFELGNNLAMEDFLVQRIKKDGALLISKKGIQAVVPKEASRFVLSGLISYTLIDDKGVTYFKPMHVFNALKLGKQQEKQYHDYSCVGAFDKYAYSVPVRESLDYNYRNYLNTFYNNQARDDVCAESGDWTCWQLDSGKRRAAAASGVRSRSAEDEEDLVALERTMRPKAVYGGHRA